jgi:hypothetical protein
MGALAREVAEDEELEARGLEAEVRKEEGSAKKELAELATGVPKAEELAARGSEEDVPKAEVPAEDGPGKEEPVEI